MQLDVDHRVLYHDREVIPLPPKAMDILLVLVEDAGQVVTRETLRQRVWENTFVEEANLTKNIGLLRSTLRVYLDDSDPIKTISKRGYQFVAPVETKRVESGAHGAMAVRVETVPQEAVPARAVKRPARLFGWGSLRWAAAAVVLVAACTGFAVDRWRLGHRGERPSLAILTLRNLSDSAADDWLGAALNETLSADLANGDGVRLVSGERVAQAERDLTLEQARSYDNRSIEAVGRRLACDLALTGSYLPEGGRIRLDLQLRNTATGAVVATFSRVTERQQLIPAVAEASGGLRKAMGLGPSAAVESYLAAVNGDAQDGMRNYVEGERLLKAGRFNEARPLLSEAVLAKPEFPLAHSALASAWQAMGYADRAQAEAKLALDTSASLPTESKLNLEASADAIFADWTKAIAAYNRLWKMHPDDLDYPAALAECLYQSGNPKQGLETLRALMASSKAAANDPRFTTLEASAAGAMADWKGQLVYAGETVRLAKANASPYFESKGLWLEGIAWSRVGDRDHGLADFREAQQISARIGDELGQANTLTSLGAEQGYRREPGAAETLRRALSLYEKMGNKAAEVMALSELGCAMTYTEDWTAAKGYFHAAIERAAILHNPAMAFGAVLDLAYVASNQDDPETELAYAQAALKISKAAGNLDGVGSSLQYLGDVEYQRGNLAAARAWYEQGLAVMKKISAGYAIGKMLNHMAWVDLAAGDLAAARRREDEIASMHVLMGERLEQQMLTEAELKIEEGHPEDVVAPMTALAEKSTTADPGAEAWRLVAKSYLVRGDLARARIAIEKALVLARRSEDTTDYLIPDTLLAARVDAADGQVAKAAATLSALLKRARSIRSERLQLEIRLAMGALAVQRGKTDEGERALQAVAREASERGFGLTARKARKTLAERRVLPDGPPARGAVTS
jgi:DNA-binding winged helix-turn-helix (wHTH) protein/tetratricopeptide (TPR) repeat protein